MIRNMYLYLCVISILGSTLSLRFFSVSIFDRADDPYFERWQFYISIPLIVELSCTSIRGHCGHCGERRQRPYEHNNASEYDRAWKGKNIHLYIFIDTHPTSHSPTHQIYSHLCRWRERERGGVIIVNLFTFSKYVSFLDTDLFRHMSIDLLPAKESKSHSISISQIYLININYDV